MYDRVEKPKQKRSRAIANDFHQNRSSSKRDINLSLVPINTLQRKKNPEISSVNQVLQLIAVTVEEQTYSKTGSNGAQETTKSNMDITVGGLNFKTKYGEAVTENGYPKFACAEANALSKVVHDSSNKKDLKTRLANAKFSRAKADTVPGGTTLKYNVNRHKDQHQYRDDDNPGMAPDFYKLTTDDGQIYVDPCGTCKSWLTYSSSGIFTVRDSLKSKIV